VISYAYLWHDEQRAGRDEAVKDRPSVIVLAVERSSDGATVVTVLPITHSAPLDATSAIEIPLPIKLHLGLDDNRSWVVVAEGNEFLWPGYDPRKLPHADRYDYGFLPPRFFDRVIDAFDACHRAGTRRLAPRD
jgi:hypothetical protein